MGWGAKHKLAGDRGHTMATRSWWWLWPKAGQKAGSGEGVAVGLARDMGCVGWFGHGRSGTTEELQAPPGKVPWAWWMGTNARELDCGSAFRSSGQV